MGLLRTLLALSVVVAHVGPIAGLKLAASDLAVQVFFIFSGFYMGLALDGKYRELPLRAFYLSRYLRLFPLYFLIFLLSTTIPWLQHSFFYDLRHVDPLARIWIGFANFSMLGLETLFFFDCGTGRCVWNIDPSAHQYGAWRLIALPQAWSLSVELLYYGFAPLFQRCRSFIIVTLIIVTGIAYNLISYGGFGLDPYRFFPTELSRFLLGLLAYRFYRSDLFVYLRARSGLWLGRFFLVLSLCLIFCHYSLVPWFHGAGTDRFYIEKLLLLYALGLPFIFELTAKSRFDAALGEVSYPIYVTHMLVYLVLQRWLPNETYRSSVIALVIVVLSFLIARTFERGVTVYRERLVQRIARA